MMSLSTLTLDPEKVMTSATVAEPNAVEPDEVSAGGGARKPQAPQAQHALLALSARDLDEELQRRLRNRGYSWE